MSKVKRATWFKLFLSQKPLFDAVSDDAVGRAIKAAMQYFDTGQTPELDAVTMAVYATLKASVDEAVADYQKAVDQGRIGGQKRWGSGEGNDATQ